MSPGVLGSHLSLDFAFAVRLRVLGRGLAVPARLKVQARRWPQCVVGAVAVEPSGARLDEARDDARLPGARSPTGAVHERVHVEADRVHDHVSQPREVKPARREP
eukprot:1776017-Prymnesium_polylepis.1